MILQHNILYAKARRLEAPPRMPSEQEHQHDNCEFTLSCTFMFFSYYDTNLHTYIYVYTPGKQYAWYLAPRHHWLLHSACSAWTSWACPCYACASPWHHLTHPRWSQNLTHWASYHPSVCAATAASADTGIYGSGAVCAVLDAQKRNDQSAQVT